MTSTGIVVILLALVMGAAFAEQKAGEGRTRPAAPHRETAEGLVVELYEAVTVAPRETPDWDRVRSLFLDQAVIVLRKARDRTSVLTVQGFVDDFVAFIERAEIEKSGFTERIVRMKPTVLGDMAHVLVLYEAHVPGGPRPPRQGVDSFSLIRKDGRWWIVSITNEIPTAERPVPEELRG